MRRATSSIQTLFVVLPFIVHHVAAQTATASDTAAVRAMMNAVSTANLTRHIAALERAGGTYSRVSYTPGNDSAVQYIVDQFTQHVPAASVVRDTFFMSAAPAPYNTRPLFNVVATLPGMAHPSSYVIIGGHLDCSGSRQTGWQQSWQTMRVPGADDNATGVAAVLEIARILGDTSFGYRSDRTFLFIAFGNEEGVPGIGGLAGSAHYAKSAKAAGMNIAAVVNLDMLGYNPSHQYVDIVANPSSQWIGSTLVDIRNRYDLDLITNDFPFVNGRYSDHASFWDQGYQAVLLIEHAWPWSSSPYYTASPYYHTPGDSLATLNLSLVRVLTQTALAAAVSIGAPSQTSVPDVAQIPVEIESVRNYPNPFNGTTNYEFAVRDNEYVTVTLYDVLGRHVTTVTEGRYVAGRHTVRWDSGSLPSGVYLCRMQAGGRTATAKVVLQR